MTNKEAIKLLLESKDNDIKRSLQEWKEWDKRYFEAIDIAIKALREPRKILFGSCLEYSGTSNLPSTQSEPQWIPCSERLPEKDGYYLTSTMYRQVYRDYWNGDNFDRTEMVIAWQSLPEPFEPDDFSQHMNPPED